MPTTDFDMILPNRPNQIQVGLEPAQNGLHSLMLLIKREHVSGLGEWVEQTAVSLTPAQQHVHRLIFQGVYYAIVPKRSYPSFLAYVDDLAAQNPNTLRDRVFSAYAKISPSMPSVEQTALLASRDVFLDYLRARFSEDHIDVAIESDSHALLNDPPAMQDLIVSHLRAMWTDALAAEWERVKGMLQTCVSAFQQADLHQYTMQEAIHQVVGQELGESCEPWLEGVNQLVFVPSAHVGPYVGKMKANGTLWLIFGAHLPHGTQINSPELSRSELLTRLSALADDTRLGILRLLSEEGELCSPEIIEKLALSQSAASRHLQQLSATGYLVERRREGAKCFTLNRERIENTTQALLHFLRET